VQNYVESTIISARRRVLHTVWCLWAARVEVALSRRLQFDNAVLLAAAFMHASLSLWKRVVDAAHRMRPGALPGDNHLSHVRDAVGALRPSGLGSVSHHGAAGPSNAPLHEASIHYRTSGSADAAVQCNMDWTTQGDAAAWNLEALTRTVSVQCSTAWTTQADSVARAVQAVIAARRGAWVAQSLAWGVWCQQVRMRRLAHRRVDGVTQSYRVGARRNAWLMLSLVWCAWRQEVKMWKLAVKRAAYFCSNGGARCVRLRAWVAWRRRWELRKAVLLLSAREHDDIPRMWRGRGVQMLQLFAWGVWRQQAEIRGTAEKHALRFVRNQQRLIGQLVVSGTLAEWRWHFKLKRQLRERALRETVARQLLSIQLIRLPIFCAWCGQSRLQLASSKRDMVVGRVYGKWAANFKLLLPWSAWRRLAMYQRSVQLTQLLVWAAWCQRWRVGRQHHRRIVQNYVESTIISARRRVLHTVWCLWAARVEVALSRRLQFDNAVLLAAAFMHASLSLWKRVVDAAHRMRPGALPGDNHLSHVRDAVGALRPSGLGSVSHHGAAGPSNAPLHEASIHYRTSGSADAAVQCNMDWTTQGDAAAWNLEALTRTVSVQCSTAWTTQADSVARAVQAVIAARRGAWVAQSLAWGVWCQQVRMRRLAHRRVDGVTQSYRVGARRNAWLMLSLVWCAWRQEVKMWKLAVKRAAYFCSNGGARCVRLRAWVAWRRRWELRKAVLLLSAREHDDIPRMWRGRGVQMLQLFAWGVWRQQAEIRGTAEKHALRFVRNQQRLIGQLVVSGTLAEWRWHFKLKRQLRERALRETVARQLLSIQLIRLPIFCAWCGQSRLQLASSKRDMVVGRVYGKWAAHFKLLLPWSAWRRLAMYRRSVQLTQLLVWAAWCQRLNARGATLLVMERGGNMCRRRCTLVLRLHVWQMWRCQAELRRTVRERIACKAADYGKGSAASRWVFAWSAWRQVVHRRIAREEGARHKQQALLGPLERMWSNELVCHTLYGAFSSWWRRVRRLEIGGDDFHALLDRIRKFAYAKDVLEACFLRWARCVCELQRSFELQARDEELEAVAREGRRSVSLAMRKATTMHERHHTAFVGRSMWVAWRIVAKGRRVRNQRKRTSLHCWRSFPEPFLCMVLASWRGAICLASFRKALALTWCRYDRCCSLSFVHVLWSAWWRIAKGRGFRAGCEQVLRRHVLCHYAALLCSCMSVWGGAVQALKCRRSEQIARRYAAYDIRFVLSSTWCSWRQHFDMHRLLGRYRLATSRQRQVCSFYLILYASWASWRRAVAAGRFAAVCRRRRTSECRQRFDAFSKLVGMAVWSYWRRLADVAVARRRTVDAAGMSLARSRRAQWLQCLMHSWGHCTQEGRAQEKIEVQLRVRVHGPLRARARAMHGCERFADQRYRCCQLRVCLRTWHCNSRPASVSPAALTPAAVAKAVAHGASHEPVSYVTIHARLVKLAIAVTRWRLARFLRPVRQDSAEQFESSPGLLVAHQLSEQHLGQTCDAKSAGTNCGPRGPGHPPEPHIEAQRYPWHGSGAVMSLREDDATQHGVGENSVALIRDDISAGMRSGMRRLGCPPRPHSDTGKCLGYGSGAAMRLLDTHALLLEAGAHDVEPTTDNLSAGVDRGHCMPGPPHRTRRARHQGPWHGSGATGAVQDIGAVSTETGDRTSAASTHDLPELSHFVLARFGSADAAFQDLACGRQPARLTRKLFEEALVHRWAFCSAKEARGLFDAIAGTGDGTLTPRRFLRVIGSSLPPSGRSRSQVPVVVPRVKRESPRGAHTPRSPSCPQTPTVYLSLV